MDKLELLYSSLNKKIDNIPSKQTLDVSQFYREAILQDGKFQGVIEEEKALELQSKFADTGFVERKTIVGMYEVLEHNDHQRKIFFTITRYLTDILDPETCKKYYHNMSIPKGAIYLDIDGFEEGIRAHSFILPDNKSCYTTTTIDDFSHHVRCEKLDLPLEKTPETIIDQILHVLNAQEEISM